jgi:hypothetical protein
LFKPPRDHDAHPVPVPFRAISAGTYPASCFTRPAPRLSVSRLAESPHQGFGVQLGEPKQFAAPFDPIPRLPHPKPRHADPPHRPYLMTPISAEARKQRQMRQYTRLDRPNL